MLDSQHGTGNQMIEIYSYFAEDTHSNTYLILDTDSGEAAVVDPSHMPSVFDISLSDVKMKYVLLTHGHFDHIGKTEKYRRAGAIVCIHRDDASLLSDGERNASALFMHDPMIIPDAEMLLSDGDVLNLGKTEIKVMHTPGHTPGSVCFICAENMFAGDTLFAGSIGRTDFWGGNMTKMRESLTKLKSLSDNYNVYSGHGPATTLDREKKYNDFMLMLTKQGD